MDVLKSMKLVYNFLFYPDFLGCWAGINENLC